ncbi:MAG: carboxypeptidase-like regulatory domain-containing protein [Planctomycetota bacterium]
MDDSDPNNDGLGLWIKAASTLALLFLLAAGLLKASQMANREDPTYVAVASTPQGATDAALGSVRGVVVDEAGQPVPNLPVQWMAVVGELGPAWLGGSVMEGGRHRTVTDADGVFELRELTAGEGQVDICVDDHLASGKPLEGMSGQIEVRAGFVATEIQVEVRQVPMERILGGTVVDADGSPAAGISIKLSRGGGLFGGSFTATRTSSADGSFLFVAPTAGGPVTLEWDVPGGGENRWKLDDLGVDSLRILLP